MEAELNHEGIRFAEFPHQGSFAIVRAKSACHALEGMVMSDLSFSDRLGMGRSRKGLRKALIGFVTLFFSYVVPFVVLPQAHPLKWFARDEKLFHEDPIVRDLPAPTFASLELTNSNSELTLRDFMRNRASESPEGKSLAEECLKKALRDEQGASRKTVAYLMALDGQFRLDGGNWKLAIKQLEKASLRLPEDPHIQCLLLRSYESATRNLQGTVIPWPVQVQEQIRLFDFKADELRRKLRFDRALCSNCHPMRAEEGIRIMAERRADPSGLGFDEAPRNPNQPFPLIQTHDKGSILRRFFPTGQHASLLSFYSTANDFVRPSGFRWGAEQVGEQPGNRVLLCRSCSLRLDAGGAGKKPVASDPTDQLDGSLVVAFFTSSASETRPSSIRASTRPLRASI